MNDDHSRPASDAYRDGWERTFGKRGEEPAEDEQADGVCHHGFIDRDGEYHPAPGYNVIITGLSES